ncbi:MAG: VOC family protein, partial [Paracoccaceae bacterium]
MTPQIKALDHLVLTVASISETLQFYTEALGTKPRSFQVADGSIRWALHFGKQKINLHQQGEEFEPKAACPVPGSADLCFLTES